MPSVPILQLSPSEQEAMVVLLVAYIIQSITLITFGKKGATNIYSRYLDLLYLVCLYKEFNASRMCVCVCVWGGGGGGGLTR